MGEVAAETARMIKSSNVVVPQNIMHANTVIAAAKETEAITAIFFTRFSIFGIFGYHFGDVASKTMRNIIALTGTPM